MFILKKSFLPFASAIEIAERLFVFDLCSSETYQRSTGADGKACAKRTPVYPAEWQNQFGLPVVEHQNQLQINIFNGFTVFGLKEDKISTSPTNAIRRGGA